MSSERFCRYICNACGAVAETRPEGQNQWGPLPPGWCEVRVDKQPPGECCSPGCAGEYAKVQAPQTRTVK